LLRLLLLGIRQVAYDSRLRLSFSSRVVLRLPLRDLGVSSFLRLTQAKWDII